MSQERVAEKASLNYKYVGRLEMGKADPGADVLVRLARALAVPVGELFETITPGNTPTDTDTNFYRLAAADAELMSTAIATLTAAVERILARQPRPLPPRAPRRARR
jgi:transcriptional regulator with XRE-family HTH domain